LNLEIKLFGRLQIDTPSRTVGQPLRQRAERLLVYLLLHRRTHLRREQVAFSLWLDLPESEALATFRRALSDLRSHLPGWEGGDWVLVTPRDIQWNASAPFQLDLDEFERLARQATPNSLHAAASLYSGDLLPEFDDEWIVAERERLRGVQLEILSRLVAHHRAVHEFSLALECAQTALALDPLAENFHREVISIRYETGDRAGALAAYDRLCIQLRDELGVEPMPETYKLAQAIARGEPLLSPDQGGKAQPAASLGTQISPIGRKRETSQLVTLWKNAEQGRGSLVIISGEAGVGKSDLTRWLSDEVTQRKGLALSGQCYQFERTLPYQPISEVLRSTVSLVKNTELLPTYRSMLTRLVPEFLDTLNLPAVEAGTAASDLRPQLYEAMLQTFLALARSQPLLLTFEHVHWAAESTLDWLTYIVPRLSKSSILMVVTCRTSEIGAGHSLKRLEQRFSREGSVQSLRLGPFDEETTRSWIANQSGLTGLRLDKVSTCLYQETGGNLFFLQELVRGLQDAEQILVGNGIWSGQFVEETPCPEKFVPEPLRAAVLTRVDRLDDLPRRFLKTAAVAGDVFYYDVIRQAESWTDDQALDALDEITQRGFIREGEVGGLYEFVHTIVEEAIYANMSIPRRMHRHREIARAIQALHPEDYEALAYHFERAGEDTQARQYHLRAAERALQLDSLSDAHIHYQSALQHEIGNGSNSQTEISNRLARGAQLPSIDE
jgi:DNA-binding SARP family transcriptional activator